MNARAPIDSGDAAALERLLAEDPTAANVLIDGKHPIHYVCDRVFDGTLQSGAPLVRALIAAGADIEWGDCDPLNAAASLGAIDVAFLLLDSGARADHRGPRGDSALHWAAYIGAADLVARLIDAGAPVDARDDEWHATPLGWALYGWSQSPVAADRGGHREAILRLARAGATADRHWLESEKVRGDAEVLAALTSSPA